MGQLEAQLARLASGQERILTLLGSQAVAGEAAAAVTAGPSARVAPSDTGTSTGSQTGSSGESSDRDASLGTSAGGGEAVNDDDAFLAGVEGNPFPRSVGLSLKPDLRAVPRDDPRVLLYMSKTDTHARPAPYRY